MHLKSQIRETHKSRRFIKYRLLLDEGLPPRNFYIELNSKHDVKHIVHELGHSGIKDPPLYELANTENRLIVVFNTKDFKPLIKPSKISVISLSNNLTNKEADLKICKALKGLTNSQIHGCLISVSKSGISTKKTETKKS